MDNTTDRDRYDLYVNGRVEYAYSTAILDVAEREADRVASQRPKGTTVEIVLIQGNRPVRVVGMRRS